MRADISLHAFLVIITLTFAPDLTRREVKSAALYMAMELAIPSTIVFPFKLSKFSFCIKKIFTNTPKSAS